MSDPAEVFSNWLGERLGSKSADPGANADAGDQPAGDPGANATTTDGGGQADDPAAVFEQWLNRQLHGEPAGDPGANQDNAGGTGANDNAGDPGADAGAGEDPAAAFARWWNDRLAGTDEGQTTDVVDPNAPRKPRPDRAQGTVRGFTPRPTGLQGLQDAIRDSFN